MFTKSISTKRNRIILPDKVQKYIDKYFIPGWQIESRDEKNYDYIVVIPAIHEFENIKILLHSLSQNDDDSLKKALILFVINNSVESSVETKIDNQNTIAYLREKISTPHASHFSKLELNPNLKLAFIDASSPGKELPAMDAGVGLARKIGMDLALTRFNYSDSISRKLIICLDCDCTVEPDYLRAIMNFDRKSFQAGYIKFAHRMPEDEDGQKAIICYEIVLRYYVLGLSYARSPFAFHTIGSTMVCNYESYIRIGGMNKRKAAEDFYFLEKLAKITKIQCIDTTTVYPSSRKSWRVPFGTGQRINRYLASTHDEYLLHDPEIFEVVKKWLAIFHSDDNFSAAEYIHRAKTISNELFTFLIDNSFESSWDKILNNSKDIQQIQKQKIMWFDGFRTMKLIHYLRDTIFPQKPMFTALERLFDKMNVSFPSRVQANELPPLDVQMNYLNLLRKLT
ncbi:MAG: hypothetical protein V1720_05660 [bacterium]